MTQTTPNGEHIKDFTANIENRYDYSKLKDWPIEKLSGQEFLLHNEFDRFKYTFPDRGSIWQGKLRMAMSEHEVEERYALTTAERLQLEDARKSAESEIYRAIGYRKQKKREQRSGTLNSIVDLSENIKYTSLSIFASIKQLKPW